MSGRSLVWQALSVADPVILELAYRLDEAAVLSGDQFSEYQQAYALVLFDPGRNFFFDWSGDPGTGRIRRRDIVDQRLAHVSFRETVLANFSLILDILLELDRIDEADIFCRDMRAVAKSYPEWQPVVWFGQEIIRACRGNKFRFLGRIRFGLHLRRVLRLASPKVAERRERYGELKSVLRHLDADARFADLSSHDMLAKALQRLQ